MPNLLHNRKDKPIKKREDIFQPNKYATSTLPKYPSSQLPETSTLSRKCKLFAKKFMQTVNSSNNKIGNSSKSDDASTSKCKRVNLYESLCFNNNKKCMDELKFSKGEVFKEYKSWDALRDDVDRNLSNNFDIRSRYDGVRPLDVYPPKQHYYYVEGYGLVSDKFKPDFEQLKSIGLINSDKNKSKSLINFHRDIDTERIKNENITKAYNDLTKELDDLKKKQSKSFQTNGAKSIYFIDKSSENNLQLCSNSNNCVKKYEDIDVNDIDRLNDNNHYQNINPLYQKIDPTYLNNDKINNPYQNTDNNYNISYQNNDKIDNHYQNISSSFQNSDKSYQINNTEANFSNQINDNNQNSTNNANPYSVTDTNFAFQDPYHNVDKHYQNLTLFKPDKIINISRSRSHAFHKSMTEESRKTSLFRSKSVENRLEFIDSPQNEIVYQNLNIRRKSLDENVDAVESIMYVNTFYYHPFATKNLSSEKYDDKTFESKWKMDYFMGKRGIKRSQSLRLNMDRTETLICENHYYG